MVGVVGEGRVSGSSRSSGLGYQLCLATANIVQTTASKGGAERSKKGRLTTRPADAAPGMTIQSCP
jgi:hypothetical protein